MTVTDPVAPTQPVVPVALDLYRDIHKGIRTELFDFTTALGQADPSDRTRRAALAERMEQVAHVLVSHAQHEDEAIEPALEQHLPDLARRIADEHVHLDARIEGLRVLAGQIVEAGRDEQRLGLHRLYLEMASFTGAYLAHQDVEERVVMPALERAIGIDAVVAIHEAILAAIPPDEMASSLAFMLPAMNVEDRTELLGGMRDGAPQEVFEGVWGLAGSVLESSDHTAVARRLGIA